MSPWQCPAASLSHSAGCCDEATGPAEGFDTSSFNSSSEVHLPFPPGSHIFPVSVRHSRPHGGTARRACNLTPASPSQRGGKLCRWDTVCLPVKHKEENTKTVQETCVISTIGGILSFFSILKVSWPAASLRLHSEPWRRRCQPCFCESSCWSGPGG